uniref:Uncharacterized protein n=1 Tax=Castor canadensis TaxID=51338 RepID=A0A8C0ZMP5_CASCN
MLHLETHLQREYQYRKAREEARAPPRRGRRRSCARYKKTPTKLTLALQGSLEFSDTSGEGDTSHSVDPRGPGHLTAGLYSSGKSPHSPFLPYSQFMGQE